MPFQPTCARALSMKSSGRIFGAPLLRGLHRLTPCVTALAKTIQNAYSFPSSPISQVYVAHERMSNRAHARGVVHIGGQFVGETNSRQQIHETLLRTFPRLRLRAQAPKVVPMYSAMARWDTRLFTTRQYIPARLRLERALQPIQILQARNFMRAQ